jgi:hypothetical protein
MSENVGASVSRNPNGHHGLYRDNFTFVHELYLLESTERQPTFWGNTSRRAPLGLFFCPEDIGEMLLRNSVDFNGLYGIISQKIILLITTALRTSNPKI